MSKDLQVHKGNVAAEDVVVRISEELRAAYEKAMTRAEVTEPRYWWNIYGFGPIQPGATDTTGGGFTSPLLANQVIRAGETAFVASLIVLNPFVVPGGTPPTPCEILQTFALPYEVNFQISNLTTWTAAGSLSASGSFVPGGPCFYVNVVPLPAQPPGMYEINITARIFGANNNPAPPFSGFARAVFDLDDELFLPAPGLQYDFPIRYQVYA